MMDRTDETASRIGARVAIGLGIAQSFARVTGCPGGRKMARILASAGFAVLAAAGGLPEAAAVEAYPQRPVRLVTGSPGSTSDITARFVAQRLGERWGQQVVVDNRPGAGGIIGAEIVARSAPDGYTLINGQIGTHASPQFLFRKLAYDPLKDFVAIAQLTTSGIALVVNSQVNAKDLREFIAQSIARPGGMTYGSAGGGTSSQLSAELFNQMTGAKLLHVPYKGAGFALTAVVSGEVQAAFLSTTTISAQVRAGKLRALAVLSPRRFSAAPDIPTAAEQGYPGIDSEVWFGLLAPARTPEPIVHKISRAVGEVMRTPEARATLIAQGAEPMPSTAQEFDRFLRAEIAKWGKVIKTAGIQPN
jgi:tripartite-type tricarboxylate transporter receptor subunit TctC